MKNNKQLSLKEKLIFEINNDFNKRNLSNNTELTNKHTDYVINSLIGKLVNNHLCNEEEDTHILEVFYCFLSNKEYDRCGCIYDWD